MNLKAVIDPGHAPGNVNKGQNGYYEYAGMWKLSNFLKTALERCGWEVKLTRTENADPSLDERGKSAAGAFLFISQHSNAANGVARGVEAYYSVERTSDKALAASLSKGVSNLMGNADRGAKTKESTTTKGKDYFGVMYSAAASGAEHIILIENGFHDNLQDESYLLIDNNLKTIAELQAKIICEYFGTTYKESGAILTAIEGLTKASARQMEAYLLKCNPNPQIPYCTAYELAEMFLAEGRAENIRGDLAWCQSLKETGFFKYGGIVNPEQNNYAGIGALNNNANGQCATFESPLIGVRAQIQHLKAYANKIPLVNTCVDPRFALVTRGTAPYIEWLGKANNPNGFGWAVPGDGYGDSILKIFTEVMKMDTGSIIPDWQWSGLQALLKLKIVEDENYWKSRMLEDRAVADCVGLMGKAFTIIK